MGQPKDGKSLWQANTRNGQEPVERMLLDTARWIGRTPSSRSPFSQYISGASSFVLAVLIGVAV